MLKQRKEGKKNGQNKERQKDKQLKRWIAKVYNYCTTVASYNEKKRLK